jgi:hypothetical protein
MSRIVITSKTDLSRTSRWLESHPEIKYHTEAGQNGFIVVVLDNAVYQP